MAKEIFIVCVDHYYPKITAVTLPSIKRYAEKISARLTIISERKFPQYPPTYEKMQIFELGKDNDVNILLDCDMYLSEDMYDVCDVVPLDFVGAWMCYDPAITIKEDEHLKLDGSDRIPATNFVLTRRGQHDLWRPFDMTPDVVLSRMKRPFVVDEYCTGRNMKRNGYKVRGLCLPGAYDNLFCHCNVTTDGLTDDVALSKIVCFK